MKKILSVFSALGVFVFLCAPWLLQSNTHYHRLIILVAWVPAVFQCAFFWRDFKFSFDNKFWVFYLFVSVWYCFSVLVNDGVSELRELKIPFYIAFFLLSFWGLGVFLKEKSLHVLLGCGVLGGFLALLSLVSFYFVDENFFHERVVSFGLWNKWIPAGQVVGVLMIICAGLGLRSDQRSWVLVLVCISLFGYLAFLLGNQTRWVWISVVIGFVALALTFRNRVFFLGVGCLLAVAVCVFIFIPESFFERGVSHRPAIWMGGGKLFLQNWVVGLGLEGGEIVIYDGLVISHPHNMFLDIAIKFGLMGFLLWSVLWFYVGWKAFCYRSLVLGKTIIALWVYSGVVVLTDGIAPWEKPAPIWFVTWLPMALALMLPATSVAEECSSFKVSDGAGG
ncbi:O-antigen ligase family protein [Geopseudomonas aromaticivorans]